jgi:hypothetical protein
MGFAEGVNNRPEGHLFLNLSLNLNLFLSVSICEICGLFSQQEQFRCQNLDFTGEKEFCNEITHYASFVLYPVSSATILPGILQQKCSLPGYFYAIILSDRQAGDRKSVKCDWWSVRVLKVSPGKTFDINLTEKRRC